MSSSTGFEVFFFFLLSLSTQLKQDCSLFFLWSLSVVDQFWNFFSTKWLKTNLCEAGSLLECLHCCVHWILQVRLYESHITNTSFFSVSFPLSLVQMRHPHLLFPFPPFFSIIHVRVSQWHCQMIAQKGTWHVTQHLCTLCKEKINTIAARDLIY